MTTRFTRKPLSRTIGMLLAAGAGLILGPCSVQGQEATIEEIAVTGSRIQRDGMSTPTPVTSVQAGEIARMAPGNLVEGLSQLPQFFGNQGPASTQSWFTRGGYGNLDLRGLGINRTLTLLNGRRMISSTVFGGVDINTFPEAMLANIETVTGGASAAYGTDAVAGVVNFVLDKEFTGFRAHVQTGTSDVRDNDNQEFSLAYGAELGSRGHILASYEEFEQDGVFGFAGRDWYQNWGLVNVGGVQRRASDVVSKNASYDGIILAPGTAINGLAFRPDGSYGPYALSDLTSSSGIGAPPSSQSVARGGSGDDFNDLATLMPDNNRSSQFLYLDYDLTDSITVFGQVIRGSNEANRFNVPRGSLQGTPTAVTIFQDNAFLPATLRQAMVNGGINSFTLRRQGSVEDLAADYRIWDSNTSTSLTGGVEWELTQGPLAGWSVDAYYQYGRNKREAYQNGLRVDRIHAAVDAVGDPATGAVVCRSTLFSDRFKGCQPLNLFGRGNASSAAVDYVIGNEPGERITTPLYFADSGYSLGLTDDYISAAAKVNHTSMEQNLFEIIANGDLFEGWAGPVSGAMGYSYRKDEVLQIVQDSTNRASDHNAFRPVSCNNPAIGLRGVSAPDCANTVGMQYSKVSNILGAIDVSEVFLETLVPLVQGQPWMQEMSLDLATRWADYSGSGEVWAWKAGLDMQLTDDLRLRGTYSRDVRAANLSERFDKTGGTATVMDPAFMNEVYNVTIFSGGNPDVAPEEADTLTAGVVWQPAFLEGFSVSYDWYEVSIDGAIGTLGTQAVVNRCFQGAQELCSLVTRGADNRLVLVGDVFVNINERVVSGSDLEVSFRRDLDLLPGSFAEDLNLRVFASWLDENSENFAGVRKVDRAGQTGIQVSDGLAYALPDFKLTANATYTAGPVTAFLQGRFIDSGTMENAAREGVNIDDNGVSSVFYTDLNLTYAGETEAGLGWELFANVTNMFDRAPPVTPYFSAFNGASTQINPNLFDILGRRYVVGMRVDF